MSSFQFIKRTMKSNALKTSIVLVAIIVNLFMSISPVAAESHWVATYGTSLQGVYPNGITKAQPDLSSVFLGSPPELKNQTMRLIVHPTIVGDTIRIRLSNVYGSQPVTFNRVTVGIQSTGAGIVEGTLREVSFSKGEGSVTIPSGERVFSDPIVLPKTAIRDDMNLSISLFSVSGTGPMTFHGTAFRTSYISAPDSGDQARNLDEAVFPFSTTSMFFLDGIDIFTDVKTTAIVAFGDSITDGYYSTINGDDTWPQLLYRRLHGEFGDRFSVINQGIGGNRIWREIGPGGKARTDVGEPGVDRMDRDVLGVSGVSTVILYMGINDLVTGNETAEQVIQGLTEVAEGLKIRGIKVIGATLTPTAGRPNTKYDTRETYEKRQAVNNFIRTSKIFDGIVDFEAAVKDPNKPSQMLADFIPNSTYGSLDGKIGDFLHPNRAGFIKMSKAFDFKLFESTPIQKSK